MTFLPELIHRTRLHAGRQGAAAGGRGGRQGGRELQEYRKKAQKLEEHQRRLQQLQEAAESAEGAEKGKITEKLRKTEKSILNAEAALRKMEATPQLKRALEKATAAAVFDCLPCERGAVFGFD